MYRKCIISLILFWGVSSTLIAQNSVSLPFLLLNPDVRTIGMGNTTISSRQGMYIYTNPSAVYMNEETSKIHASYSLGIFPKVENSREFFNTLSLGYRLSERHTIFGGVRHVGGMKVNGFDLNGHSSVYRPSDYSIDLGYAFLLDHRFSMFARASYIGSRGAYTLNSGLISLGISYHQAQEISNRPLRYSLAIALDNWGPKLKYDGLKNVSYNPPASVGLGGDISLDLSHNDRLTCAFTSKYFFLSGYNDLSAMLGAEYIFLKRTTSVRAGYEWGIGHNVASLGLGYRYRFVKFDIAYRILNSSTYNSLHFGIGFDF